MTLWRPAMSVSFRERAAKAMSSPFRSSQPSRILPALVVGGGAWMILDHYGLPPLEVMFTHPVTAAAAVMLGVSTLAGVTDTLRLLARYLDWRAARKPTGLKGTAGFVTSLREIRKDLCKGWGPYFGAFKGKPIFANFDSSALIVGPSGSGKNVCVYQPNALALHGFSKVFIDFRGDQTAVLKAPLEKHGNVIVLNLGGQYEDEVGLSARYNPLCVIVDDFWRPGGLQDVVENVAGMCLWLYPEPSGQAGSNDNRYFRDGSRTLICVAIFLSVLVHGDHATLGDVLGLLTNRTRFLAECQWAAGRLTQNGSDEPAAMPIWHSPWVAVHPYEDVRRFVEWLRDEAAGVADLLEVPESRTLDSFITGAQQALSVFNSTTRAARIFQDSTFRFGSLKEGEKPTSAFLILDPNKIETQSRLLGLVMYCLLLELRRHSNKQRDVYVFADEVSNIPWPGLGSLITWSRAYHVKFLFFLQNFPAFKAAHGEETMRTLQSECEIQLFLPNQREPETLAFLEQKLGTASVMVKGNRGSTQGGPFSLDGYDLREEGRPLLVSDEIRRSEGKGILFIRNRKPLLVDLPSIAEIAPWRRQIGINPFYGKKFLKPTKLRI
jgi:type IV secretion system protein VirD4